MSIYFQLLDLSFNPLPQQKQKYKPTHLDQMDNFPDKFDFNCVNTLFSPMCCFPPLINQLERV